MKNKKLGIALVTLTIFTNACAKKDSGVYQPKSPWPFVVAEDAVVGTAGVLTLGQTDADPTALPMTIPDAIPGVSYARTKDDSCKKECNTENKRKRVKKEKKSSSSKSTSKKMKQKTEATAE